MTTPICQPVPVAPEADAESDDLAALCDREVDAIGQADAETKPWAEAAARAAAAKARPSIPFLVPLGLRLARQRLLRGQYGR